MFRSLMVLVVLGCSVLPWGSTPCHALSVHFNEISPLEVVEGSNFSVELLADIGVNEQILGWDIDLDFDPSQMSFLGFTPSSVWNSPATPYPDDDVSIAGLAFLGFPPSTGVYGEDILLATIAFECLAIGTSVLNISIDDPEYEGFISQVGDYVSWTSTPLTINQVPVPEPSTALLIVIGMIAVVGINKFFPNKNA